MCLDILLAELEFCVGKILLVVLLAIFSCQSALLVSAEQGTQHATILMRVG
jgi:hypothetical protein